MSLVWELSDEKILKRSGNKSVVQFLKLNLVLKIAFEEYITHTHILYIYILFKFIILKK